MVSPIKQWLCTVGFNKGARGATLSVCLHTQANALGKAVISLGSHNPQTQNYSLQRHRTLGVNNLEMWKWSLYVLQTTTIYFEKINANL